MAIVRGTLIISKNKKGQFYAEFLPEGRSSKQPLSFWKPKGEEFNNKAVEIHREGSKVVALKLQNGGFIYQANVTPKTTSTNTIQNDTFMDSFNAQKTCLSANVKSALSGLDAPDNFYLKFYKAARFDRQKEGLKFMTLKVNDRKEKKGEIEYLIQTNYEDTEIHATNHRVLRSAERLGFSVGKNTLSVINVKNSWRWVVGLGNSSVYENGITLHHIYGIPYIPGSAVKGVVRNWIISNCFNANEAMANEDGLFCFLFGKGGNVQENGRKGNIFFFDSFPTEKPNIEPDIMNNHYQDYYDGKTPPADWLPPNPIMFMSVKGGSFSFLIAAKKNITPNLLVDRAEIKNAVSELYKNDFCNINLSQETQILAIVTEWLKNALENHGIGAKTAVGYGRMQSI